MFFRKVGSIPMLVLKGGATSLEVDLLPYSHRTYNEDKRSWSIVDSRHCQLTKCHN